MVTLPARRPFEREAVDQLRTRVRGTVLLPEEDGYDEARSVWNAMIDRYPAVIVRALGAADVMQAVEFARDHELEIAIKGGGHNVAGNAVCDDGLTLDLSRMKSVRVDPDARTARVEPGAVLHDVDQETQAHGLVLPGGFVSSTGIAGLTLGGGFGYLSRKYGLTVDSLRSVDLVTADAELVRASEDENPDLFWGLRGGGGNFGVVTSFEFDLHELDPTVLAGPVAHMLEDASQVMREVSDVMREAPDEVSCLMAIRHAPPAPFLPEAVHGERILLIAVIYGGPPEEGEEALAPLREIGDPVTDAVSPRPYTAFQSTFDAATAAGARNYWKSHYVELSGDVIDTLCEHAERLPTPESTIGMLALGGEISRRPDDSAPYPHRDAPWVVNVQSRWRDPVDDDRSIAWARELFDALTPHARGGVYVNFVTETHDEERIRAAYGEGVYDRLADLKAEWDPENVFHLNQNIEPSA